jgi:hypothetical protein
MQLTNFRLNDEGHPVFDATFNTDEHNYLLMVALGVLIQAGIANMKILSATAETIAEMEVESEDNPQAIFNFDIDLEKIKPAGNA